MANIERDLGPEWPKRLYPHGGGREWSTNHRDDEWKLSEAFEVVPAEDREKLLDLLEKIAQECMTLGEVDVVWIGTRARLAVDRHRPGGQQADV